MNKLKKWYNEHKEKPLFKAKLLLVILIVLAIGAQIFVDYRDKRETIETETSVTETETEETDEQNLILIFWENSRAHFAAFIGVTAALAVVQIKKKQKLKESG